MRLVLLGSLLFILSGSVIAKTVVTMQTTQKPIKTIGTITFNDSRYGLLIKPHLHGLKPGTHGFHIHVNPSCDKHGKAAGGHFDPENTGQHLGPYDSKGHLGDMPVLYVDQQGRATQFMLAPRLHEKDLYHKSIMIHAGGDNYSDHPKPLGGGGARVACGVVGH